MKDRRLKKLLRVTFPGLCVAAVFVAPQVQQSAFPRSFAYVAIEEKDQKTEDSRAALNKYLGILATHPTATDVLVKVGLIYHQLGEESKAVEQFQTALKQDPNLLDANLFAGVDLLQLRQPQQALRFLQRAYHLAPRDERVLDSLAHVYAILGQFDRANRLYLQLSHVNPKNINAWYGLGVTYFSIQRVTHSRLYEGAPDSVYSRTLLADTLLLQGEADQAAQIYSDLIAKTMDQLCAHARLGLTHLRRKAFEDADQEFRIERQQHPGCLLAEIGMGALALDQGENEDALRRFELVLRTDSGFFVSKATLVATEVDPSRLSAFATEMGGRPGAARLIVDALESVHSELDPASAPGMSSDGGIAADKLYAQSQYAQCTLALRNRVALSVQERLLLSDCAYNTGDYSVAFDSSRKVLESSPSSAAALYWETMAADSLALAAMERAVSLDPKSPKVHLLLAEANRVQHKFAEEEREYNQVIELEPRNIDARLALVTAYCQTAQYDDGLRQLDAILAIRPQDPEANYLKAEILMSRKEENAALPFLKNAMQANKAIQPRVHALLGRAYAVQGNTTEAIHELKAALNSDRDGSYHYQLYRLFLKIGDTDAAKAALERSMELRSNQHRKEADPPAIIVEPPL
jgi:tetratricopeptide (TPR) repeat protein